MLFLAQAAVPLTCAIVMVQDDPVPSQGLSALLALHPDSTTGPASQPRPVGDDHIVAAAYAFCGVPSGRWWDQHDVSLWNMPSLSTSVLEGIKRSQANPLELMVRKSYLCFKNK